MKNHDELLTIASNEAIRLRQLGTIGDDQNVANDIDALIKMQSEDNVGKDVCYECGCVQKYRTMTDISTDSFAIYCDECYTRKIEGIRSEVITQIERDISMDDYTSIYELIKFIPIDYQLGYLSEDVANNFKK